MKQLDFINEMFDIKTAKSYPFTKQDVKDSNIVYQASFETDAHISYTFRILKKMPFRNYGRTTRIIALYKKQVKSISQNLTIDPGTMKKVLVTFFKCYEDYKNTCIDANNVNSYSIALQSGIAKFASMYVRVTARAFRMYPKTQLVFHGINTKGKNGVTELFFINKTTRGLPVFSGPDWKEDYMHGDEYINLCKLGGVKIPINPKIEDDTNKNTKSTVLPSTIKKDVSYDPIKTPQIAQQALPDDERNDALTEVPPTKDLGPDKQIDVSNIECHVWYRYNNPKTLVLVDSEIKEGDYIFPITITKQSDGTVELNMFIHAQRITDENDQSMGTSINYVLRSFTFTDDDLVLDAEYPTDDDKMTMATFNQLRQEGYLAIDSKWLINMYEEYFIKDDEYSDSETEHPSNELQPSTNINAPIVEFDPIENNINSIVRVGDEEIDIKNHSVFELRDYLNNIDTDSLTLADINQSIHTIHCNSNKYSAMLMEYISDNYNVLDRDNPEAEAFVQYTGIDYFDINELLRTNVENIDFADSKELFDKIRNIDIGFKKYGMNLLPPIKLFRGTIISNDEIEMLKQDKYYELKSYGSFSSSPSTAIKFLNIDEQGFFKQLKSESPKSFSLNGEQNSGKVFIELNDVSNALVVPAFNVSSYTKEYEYILNRDSVLQLENNNDFFEIAIDPYDEEIKLYYFKSNVSSSLKENFKSLYSFSDWVSICEDIDIVDDINTKLNAIGFYLQILGNGKENDIF